MLNKVSANKFHSKMGFVSLKSKPAQINEGIQSNVSLSFARAIMGLLERTKIPTVKFKTEIIILTIPNSELLKL